MMKKIDKNRCVIPSNGNISIKDVENCLEKEFAWLYNVISTVDTTIKKDLKQLVDIFNYAHLMISRELADLEKKEKKKPEVASRKKLMKTLQDITKKEIEKMKVKVNACKEKIIDEELASYEKDVIRAIADYLENK